MLEQIIIVYPLRFTEFDRKRFEVGYLKKHTNVIIYDLLDSLNKHFSEAYHDYDESKDVKKLSSVFAWRKSYLESLKNFRGQSYVINFVQPHTFKELFINYVLSSSGVPIIEYANPGIPTYTAVKQSFLSKIRTKYFFIIKRASFKWMVHVIKYRVVRALYSILCRKSDFILSVGKSDKNSSPSIISANSFDYSMILEKSREFKNSNQDNIIFLDSGGPLFKTDSFMYGNKHPLSKELWYPALVNFFNIIEKQTGNKVVVAAHPKHKYTKESSQYFGSRQVIHDKSMDLISQASIVITLNSTAVSYAVMFNKPVIFLISNEVINDGNILLQEINFYASILGTSAINVDRVDDKLITNLTVNSEKYILYKNKYLSSRSDNKTNGEIIMDDVIKGISNDR